MKNGLYQNFARFYDKVYHSLNNEKVTDFIVSILAKHGNKGKEIMDMACGTGEQALGLSKKGFNVIGVDLNEKMLDVAIAKTKKIQFLKGDMRSFKARKKLDAVTCLLSAINHNRNLDELKKTIQNFYGNLNTGGVCIFDLGFVNKKKDNYPQGCQLNTFADKDLQLARISQWVVSSIDENIYDTQDLFLVKENGKIDFEIDRYELGLFEVKDVKKIMEKAGFEVMIFEPWSVKKFTTKTRRPIFVGIKK